MTNQTKLVAKKRVMLGTAESRRLRRQGITPGILYGHGVEPVSVSIPKSDLRTIVISGTQVVDVDVDGQVAKAIIRELQWDTFGTEILHVDLIRVDADERVDVSVLVELRGTAAGTLSGGVLEQPLHELDLDCLAISIPEKIVIRVSDLEIGQAIHVGDLELDESARPRHPADAIIVRVVEPTADEEEEGAEIPAGAVEPELVGKKAQEDGADDAS